MKNKGNTNIQRMSRFFTILLLGTLMLNKSTAQTIFWPRVDIEQKGKLIAVVSDFNNAVFTIQHQQITLEDTITGDPYLQNYMHTVKHNSTGRRIWFNERLGSEFEFLSKPNAPERGITPKIAGRTWLGFPILGEIAGTDLAQGFFYNQAFDNGFTFFTFYPFAEQFSSMSDLFDASWFCTEEGSIFDISWLGNVSKVFFSDTSMVFHGRKLFTINSGNLYSFGRTTDTDRLIIYSHDLGLRPTQNITLDADVNFSFTQQDTAFLFYPDFIKIEIYQLDNAELTKYDYADFIGYDSEQIRINDFIRRSDLSFVAVGDILDTDSTSTPFFMTMAPDGSPTSVHIYEADYFPFESIVNIVEIPLGLVVGGSRQNEEGEYEANLFLLDKSGLITTSTTQHVINNSLIKIFPNPVSDILQIELSEYPVKGNLEIFHIDGKLVFSSGMEENLQVDVSNWPNAVYIVKVTTPEYTSSKRVLVFR